MNGRPVRRDDNWRCERGHVLVMDSSSGELICVHRDHPGRRRWVKSKRITRPAGSVRRAGRPA